jgi:predicted DNA-binding protein YlxM (UPF0122 family)
MRDELERTMRMNYLYDFYHSLLTDKQRGYVELYYLEDYSFSEIAETLDVTRQAVYDNLKRTKDLLEDYEKNLGMYKNFIKRQALYQELEEILSDHTSDKVKAILKQLESLD